MKLIWFVALVWHLQQPIFNTKQTTRIIGYFYPFLVCILPIQKLINKRFCNPQRSKSSFLKKIRILNTIDFQKKQKRLIAL